MRDEGIGCMIFIFIIAFIFFIGFAVITSFNKSDLSLEEYETYEDYKKSTEVIEGQVIKAEKNSKIFLPDDYNLVVSNNKGISKMVEVDENKYKNYQKGSNVKFRIDKEQQNKVLLDLNKENDITNKKEFKNKLEDEKSVHLLDEILE
ncbi:hypothetical protein ACJVW9_04945 [Staphylococcus pseudintermedius]|uniref:hypothetical protein n=1 Tax=Staphylococcus pseudintermedius TaxID=283734 RepID=UPI000A9CD5DF|nr:hypothetical protein [Staphylococcus aureus]